MRIFIASSEEYVENIKEDLYIRDMFVAKRLSSKISTLKIISKLAGANDIVILKSIWGYHLDPIAFLSILDDLKRNNVRLINKYNFIRWNINKSVYLAEVSRYASIVPTISFNIKIGDTEIELDKKLKYITTLYNTNKLVIKPAVSASGFLTHLYQIGLNNENTLASIIKNFDREFIAQPYRDSIAKGELSVVLLQGNVLYGMLRLPGLFYKKGSPTYVALEMIPSQILKIIDELKRFFFDKFNSLPEICRIDFLENSGTYEILEIELIDPDLYIKHLNPLERDWILSFFYKMM